ncbi:MAG: exosortase A [Gammaproteobacteria bacterium]|nr:exosortase A [Gammaproteobacteria bacterium]
MSVVAGGTVRQGEEAEGEGFTSPWRVGAWRYHIMAIVIGLGTLVAVFWSTYASMVAIWERSETFAHGYLIFPIALFLVWRMRGQLANSTPSIDYRALVILVGLGFGWALAAITDVAVVKQFAAVGMIPALVWLFVGWKIAFGMMFPLLFVLLAVPIGEGLILPMMEFTADFTIAALHLTGIPVYREGMFFSLPTGNWSIVEGCSGVRYLIASITLGFLYAYLTYQSYFRRICFIALSILVPIIGNGLRAYMIVMIGHTSSMKYATGVDHLIYGWVFFGIIMMVLFWVGSYWREDAEDDSVSLTPNEPVRGASLGAATLALVCGVVGFSAWPAWAHYLEAKGDQLLASEITVAAPDAAGGWVATAPITEWRPQYQGPSAESHAGYESDGQQVGVHIAYYPTQAQDRELVNTQNVMIRQKHPIWSERYKKPIEITIAGQPVRVLESWMKSHKESYLAWHWYWLDGHSTVNPYDAKVREAFRAILGRDRDGAGIVVYTSDEAGGQEAARAVLQGFIDKMLPSIRASVLAARPPG